jgi:hypothetical protein
MALSGWQQLLANPIAAHIGRVLLDPAHGPAVLERWIAERAELIPLIDQQQLVAGITAHPLLLRLGRGPITRAVATMGPEAYAHILDCVHGQADALALECYGPEWAPAGAQALRQMAVRIGQDPDAFRWFCGQLDQLKARVLAVLQGDGDNPVSPR